ncbi:MAG TPA: HAMP domain-containing methyl-accepting chemotaxis protein [Polyangiaceae bacterium]
MSQSSFLKTRGLDVIKPLQQDMDRVGVMGSKNLTARTVFAFATLDVLFTPLVSAFYLRILGIGAATSALSVLVGLVILKVVACAKYISWQLQPYEAFAAMHPSEHAPPELVLRADERLQGFASRVGVFYAATWALTYGLAFVALQSTVGKDLVFPSGTWEVVGLFMLGVWCGGFAAGAPLVAFLSASACGDCSMRARQMGITLPRVPESLQLRIAVTALALAIGPTSLSTAIGYVKQTENLEHQNQTAAEALVARVAQTVHLGAAAEAQRKVLHDLRAQNNGIELTLVDHQGRSIVPDEDGEFAKPSYALQVLERAKVSPRSTIRNSGKSERIAYQRLEDGVTAVARVDLPAELSGYLLTSALFALAIGLWAPISALILGRAITTPVERLTSTTERIVQEGKQSELAALPVVRNDEVGRLSTRFNDLLDMMKDLGRAADAIAAGELCIEVTRKGELPDAFRRMLDSLRNMVREIRGTSVDLASAAAEILAASQEQESAAASQSSAMEEISRTMDSLSSSAAHVSDSVRGVLANAEQTLSTTDRMVARITELSSHANRIGEILDVIREIADRSDLLALNGSLEASRAGEGGHGFALVAAEMRRLAERVTVSVEDVKRLVSDIRDSGSSTVAATEEGRRLADGTTEAARQITFVTQQQRSGTEQVSESIRSITDVVTQAVSATAQTRTSAQSLKSQADRLAALVKRFELEEGVAA